MEDNKQDNNKHENKKLQKIKKESARLKRLKEKSQKKAKGFLHDFKEFATKGNVIDMAVGVIIATAFTKIVNSLVNDVITPVISIFTGKVDFSNLFIALDGNKYSTLADATKAGVSVVNYGAFVSNIVNFIMIALILFIFLKVVLKNINGKLVKDKETPKTKECPFCLNEIPIKATRCGHCTSVLEEDNK